MRDSVSAMRASLRSAVISVAAPLVLDLVLFLDLAQRAGAQVISVPVDHRPRTRGQSKYGTWQRLWVGIIDLFGVMWLQRRARQPVVTEE